MQETLKNTNIQGVGRGRGEATDAGEATLEK